jgi:hypothetical protein
MKLHLLILQDHYRRWWWAHLLGFLLFAAIGVQVGHGLDPHWIPLGAGALLGSAVALTALTNARILLALPIRASELGATLWWIVVPLSGLVPTFGLTVGWTVSGRFGSAVPIDVGVLLWFLLLTQAVSAFQFTVVSLIPNAETHHPREKTPGVFTVEFGLSGLIASCFFPLYWPESRALWDPLSCGILAMGVICGLVSWHRCTAFLLKRARRNEGLSSMVALTVASTVVLPKPSRFDGVAVLFLPTLLRSGLCGFGLSALGMSAIPSIIWTNLFRSGAQSIGFVVLLSAGMDMTVLSSLRHLRTLPFSAARLAWTLIGLQVTVWNGLILPLVATECLIGTSLGGSALGAAVFGSGWLAIQIAFALRFGAKWAFLAYALLIFSVVGLPSLGVTFGPTEPLVAGVLLIFVAQAWMARTLRHQSRIFSPGFHQFGRLNSCG